jgi:hypothetical protein
MLSTPIGSGTALAKIIWRKQLKVGERHAQIHLIFDNAGSSLKSYRGMWLFNWRRLR